MLARASGWPIATRVRTRAHIMSSNAQLAKNWSITMSSVNASNKVHPSVEPPGVKSPLAHDSVTIACPVCGSSFSPSGRRTYCSDACRAVAYRRRRRSRTLPTLKVPRSQPRRSFTVYECDSCGERSLGEQRCSECHTFMRRVGIGGHCPSCDESVAISELIGTEFIVEP